MNPVRELYGLMAEFDSTETLLRAATALREEGYAFVDAFAPFPIEGLGEALGKRRSRVPMFVLIGGLVGCFGGFFMQWFASVHHYPVNSGGRPLNSWPAFIPITFELTVLCAGFSALFSLIYLNRHPQLYHPAFNANGFGAASLDRFFLCIQSSDPKFSAATESLLRQLGARAVVEVEK